MDQKKREVIVAIVIALVVACLFFWLALRKRGETGEPVGTTPPPAGGPAATAPATAPAAQPGVTGAAGQPPAPAGAKPGEQLPAPAAAPTATPEWEPQPEVEFGPDDLKGIGQGVSFDLGTYSVRVGDEFEVTVSYAGPPLMLLMLGLDFDPAVLEVLPESARPVGKVIRSGIEFYADNAKGKMVLLQTGTPGMKNVNRAMGGTLAAFRMRAKAAGNTMLTLPEKGAAFNNAKGENEKAVILGGSIVVTP